MRLIRENSWTFSLAANVSFSRVAELNNWPWSKRWLATGTSKHLPWPLSNILRSWKYTVHQCSWIGDRNQFGDFVAFGFGSGLSWRLGGGDQSLRYVTFSAGFLTPRKNPKIKHQKAVYKHWMKKWRGRTELMLDNYPPAQSIGLKSEAVWRSLNQRFSMIQEVRGVNISKFWWSRSRGWEETRRMKGWNSKRRDCTEQCSLTYCILL